MSTNYINGKGILLGEYTGEDLKKGKDMDDFKKCKQEHSFIRTMTKEFFIRDNQFLVRIYACTYKDVPENLDRSNKYGV